MEEVAQAPLKKQMLDTNVSDVVISRTVFSNGAFTFCPINNFHSVTTET